MIHNFWGLSFKYDNAYIFNFIIILLFIFILLYYYIIILYIPKHDVIWCIMVYKNIMMIITLKDMALDILFKIQK